MRAPSRTTSALLLAPLIVNAAAAQSEPAAPDDQSAAPIEKKLPLGYLSDPDAAPKDLFDALITGKIHLDNRLRFEFADTTDREQSTALTNRFRFGYETKPFAGFSGMIEMENVFTPDKYNYWVPATGDGSPSRTVIADPAGTEINQAYGRYDTDDFFGRAWSLDVRGGRQRIQFDDDRFIGNVGWRQFEQTYDAARLQTNLGVSGLALQYAYVWRVQRIFGPDGPNWDSDSHLINVRYKAADELTVTPFVYLLDFRDDSPLDSVDNIGVRLTGDLWRDPDDEADLYFDYEITYARQSDAGDNPVDFEADFLALQGRVTKKGLGAATIGYQLLGSDDGAFGFRFPLGTNHKFQGFADQFLTTPATGLQDLYVAAALDLPFGIKSSVVLHQFWSDEGSQDLGHEIDLVASKKINANWSVTAKAAFFDGRNEQPDTTRVWVQTTFRF